MSVTMYILWALPRGETDRLHEKPLTSMPLTETQADRVQRIAERDGWHGFQRVVERNELPNFAAAVTRSTDTRDDAR